MPNYVNGMEIRGTPKTVNLEAQFKGQTHAAPLEVWIAAIVATMTAEEKERLFQWIEKFKIQRDLTRQDTARIVADIPMPKL